MDRQISKLSDCQTKPLRPLEKPGELLQPYFRIWIRLTSLNNAKKNVFHCVSHCDEDYEGELLISCSWVSVEFSSCHVMPFVSDHSNSNWLPLFSHSDTSLPTINPYSRWLKNQMTIMEIIIPRKLHSSSAHCKSCPPGYFPILCLQTFIIKLRLGGQ